MTCHWTPNHVARVVIGLSANSVRSSETRLFPGDAFSCSLQHRWKPNSRPIYLAILIPRGICVHCYLRANRLSKTTLSACRGSQACMHSTDKSDVFTLRPHFLIIATSVLFFLTLSRDRTTSFQASPRRSCSNEQSLSTVVPRYTSLWTHRGFYRVPQGRPRWRTGRTTVSN